MPTLPELWSDSTNHNKSAKTLADLAGVKVATARAFIKKNHESAQLTEANTNKQVFCPAGSPLPGHYQADCIFMKPYRNQNSQNIAILTVIETITRKAYAERLTNLKAPAIIKAFKAIDSRIQAEGGKAILYLRSDNGAEFTSEEFKKLMDSLKIIHTFAEPNLSSNLNRTNSFHRTLRYRFRDLFLQNGGKTKWIHELQNIVNEFNETPSRAFDPSLGHAKTPNSITQEDKQEIIKHETKRAAHVRAHDDLILSDGDHVRLSAAHTRLNKVKKGNKFIKPSMAITWTPQVYKVIRNGPNTWRIFNTDDSEPDEIRIWQTYNLLKVPKAAADAAPHPMIEAQATAEKQQRVNQAQMNEERNISRKERKTLVSKTRGEGVKTRSRAGKRVDYAKLAKGN
jgi:hypothetical protein